MTGTAPDATQPAYYARSRGTGGPADWWTLLHPPYTAWHLSYVVVGAALARHLDGGRLAATVAAFALGMGVGAHALDELAGHPLRTGIADRALVAAAAASIAAAVAVGVTVLGVRILPFAAAGVVLVVGYNLELAGGVLHNLAGFAGAWGAFPVLTAYYAQTGTVAPAALAAAAAAFGLSAVQRVLSLQARELRRRTVRAEATLERADGTVLRLDGAGLRAPYEAALRALTWSVVAVAVTGLLAHYLPGWA